MTNRTDWLQCSVKVISKSRKKSKVCFTRVSKAEFLNTILLLIPSWNVLTAAIIVRNGKHQVELEVILDFSYSSHS